MIIKKNLFLSSRLRSCGLFLIWHGKKGEIFDNDIVLRRIACFYIELTKILTLLLCNAKQTLLHAW